MKSRGINKLIQTVAAQVEAYEKRNTSRFEKNYDIAMQKSATVLAEFVRTSYNAAVFCRPKPNKIWAHQY